MSNLRSLYTAIAGMSVTFTPEAGGSSAPTAYDLDALPRTAETADLPLRVLLPLEEWGGDGPALDLLAAGTTGVGGAMTWNVVDLMLYEAVGQSRGLLDVLADLVRYAAAYADAILDNRNPVANVRLMGAAIRPGVFEWPLGTGRNYYGVECALTFEELINP